MKNLNRIFSALALLSLLAACTHEPAEPTSPDPNTPPDTIFTAANTIYHIPIGQTLEGVSAANFLIDSATGVQVKVDIIKLSGTNSFAARVAPSGCELLDASTYGYPDALQLGAPVEASGNWAAKTVLLGTSVGHTGQFEAAGNRYLPFRFKHPSGAYHYGWIQFNCQQGNQLVLVIDLAFDKQPGLPIWAGQTQSGQTAPPQGASDPIQSIQQVLGNYRDQSDPGSAPCSIYLTEVPGEPTAFYVQYFSFMRPYPKFKGQLVNGTLLVPNTFYSGNIPSPGGTPRPYEANFSGTAQLFLTGGQLRLDWQIKYTKTGFLAESYNGLFQMYKCD